VSGPEIGIGIIGSGYMGRTYAECVARYNNGARLIAVAGGSRAPGLAADYRVDAEPSVEALLERADIQAVIVTSPQSAHCQQTLVAAKHGKHVLVEKPMATSTGECREMIHSCQRPASHCQSSNRGDTAARLVVCTKASSAATSARYG